MRRKTNATKKRGNVVGAAAGASGAGSVISAHNVCHAICLAVVSLLSVFGIIVSSDILMWLQDYNMLFWGMGLAFLFISLALLVRYKNCISRELIIFNTGLLIAGVPFMGDYDKIAWIIGGIIAASAIYLYAKKRLRRKNRR